MRLRGVLSFIVSVTVLVAMSIGQSGPVDVLVGEPSECRTPSATQVRLIDSFTYHEALPWGEDVGSALANSALAHADVRLLEEHVRSLGFSATGVIDTYVYTDVGPEVRVAVLSHEGPNGATAGIVYATSATNEEMVVAKYQVPEPDPAYRVVTELQVVNGEVSSGSGIRMNSGGSTFCPPGQCRVSQTCGGTTDMVCLAACQTGCQFVPLQYRAACMVGCWPACYIPAYNCDYCEPC